LIGLLSNPPQIILFIKNIGELGGARLRRQANRCRPFKPALGNASEGNAKKNAGLSWAGFFLESRLTSEGLPNRELATLSIIQDRIPALLDRVRTNQPVVHAITNWVTGGDVANALQALGARPVLALAQEEVAEITSQSDALLLNLGTPDSGRIEAMLRAGRQANELGKPIVFDPVGAGASSFRKEAWRQILSELKITIVRGNRAEIGMLAGRGGRLRGIDAVSGPDDLQEAVRALSRQTGAVVMVSGEQDLLSNGNENLTWGSGHPFMLRVTGTGCMLSAVITAFTAVGDDPLAAAAAGVSFFKLAGRRAGETAHGPGTFKTALLDFLYTLSPEDLQKSNGLEG
jgi:hydroxyethylthiazole kinase